MNALRRHLTAFSRLALALMLGLALLPSLSKAMAARSGALEPWAELCSAGSSRPAVAAPDGQAGQQPAAPAAMHREHCPLCGHASHLPMLPMLPISSTVPRMHRGVAHPALFTASPRPLFAWRAAQPRGPPSA